MKDEAYLKENGINLESSLELLGDIETYNDILGDFIDGYDEKIGLIKKYKEESDMPNYAIQVHSLKSDAKYLGMKELADISYEHELKSKANDEAYVNENIRALLEIANKYYNIAREYLGKANDLESGETKMEGKAILIADDSTIIRNIAEKMINGAYTLLHATDGNEAIKVVSENKDNLCGLLLDLNMPNVDGFEVLKYFKENNLFTTIPVVIITGDDSKETIMKAFDYPIVDVLAKPFNENDVKRVLTTMSMNR
jgi:CheY-like chemotaxis protein/HPt (histidine-containing phosphotransfer) domain-containing protein